MRLIDADALIADIQERYCKPCKKKGDDYNGVRCRACWVDDAIDEVDGFGDNAIDAVSVVRSEWIMDMGEVWICRNCGNGYKDQPTCMGKPMFEYCPFCGAKMDGERKGE